MFLRSVLLLAVVFVASPAEATQTCMRATHSLIAGQVPSEDDLIPTDCGDVKPASVVRYDADLRSVRFARSIQPNEIIGSIPKDLMAAVTPGQRLYVSVKVGPVTVERVVEAMQPAKPGQSLFVRTADGQIMKVLYSEGDQ